ncbi:TIGR04219 family outer membrane beta-barrel protein [Vibrio diazotrophicus]|uniref:Iron-hydroxamate ABC transporter substrate-binding protein n=1 Tax=Vibrio diazotrophicus TaxID=685 RepID=A0ABX4W5Z9_VIBDI|nr:iron-hydroxamate ABC transporter substrate-binding protein [Vibrio diazotrophicus]
MNKPIVAVFTSLLMIGSAPVWCANSPVGVKVAADMWLPSTKIDNTRRDDANSPVLNLAFEHQLPYLPNVSVRYTNLDADYASYDKFDYTFYYNILERDLMTFDAGISMTQYANSEYKATDGQKYSFDDLTFNWYAHAEISVPETNFDIIGQFEFGDSDGIKSSDVIAGVQYVVPLAEGDLSFRGGYRVIDLEFTDLVTASPNNKMSYVFADGWFLGAQFKF